MNQVKLDVVAVQRHMNGVYIDDRKIEAAIMGKSYTTGSRIPKGNRRIKDI